MVALYLSSGAFANFDARSLHISDRQAQEQLAGTLALNENTDHGAVRNRAVLDNHLVVRLSTSEDSTSSELSKGTI